MKKLFAILAALMVLLSVGCAAKSQSLESQLMGSTASSPAAYDTAMPEEPAAPAEAAGVFEQERGQSDSAVADMYGGHKIIATFNLEMTTDAFDEHYALLNAKVQELGGYVQDASVSGTKPETYHDYGRTAHLTFRVPSSQAEAFIDYAGGTGTITHRSKSTQDVTLDYYDSETRLNVLKTQLERLQSILVETDNLADIVELEKAIAEVTIQIEQMTTQLRRYDNLIDYSTVYVYMHEERLIAGPSASQSIGERISKGFISNLSGVGVFLEDFFVWFIVSLPILVLLAVVIGGIVLIIMRVMRKRRAKRAQGKAAVNNPPAWVQPETKQEDSHEKQ